MSDPKRVVKLAKQFREVLEVAEDLEKIGNLEQATRNAEATVDKVKQEVWDIQVQLTEEAAGLREVKDDLKLVKKEAEDTISLAKQAAQEIISDAKEEAEAVVKVALERERLVTDRIVEDQERHAVQMAIYVSEETEARDAVEAIEKELKELRERIG